MEALECAGKIIKMSRRATFGPNYVVEAYLRGPIDARTGLLVNLIDIDEVLKDVISQVEVAKPSYELIKDLFQEITVRLPNKFPDVAISLDKVRLRISEELYLEYGI
jgi:hypothetical protein